ncbi:hypothetical protein L596_030641 [Steinernema carpocapsae]|uniref:Mitochondrial carrier protein n=1 Tax=Steinernema carpocapsae TaxID=34508 RepID=A0A4U5LQ00_STECR|nr:hypothetical protein L596_030641 [Steinernema carpocapsae]
MDASPAAVAQAEAENAINNADIPDEQNDEDMKRVAKIAARSAVLVVTHPLAMLKTLFQLGFEPYPLSQGKTLVVAGRDAYFLPNLFAYGRNLTEELGFMVLYSGFEANLFASCTSRFVNAEIKKYIDKYYPELGGSSALEPKEPEKVQEEELNENTEESFRVMIRSAMRSTVVNWVGIVVSRPFTVLMVRQIGQLIGGELKYYGLIPSMLRIGREEGPAGYFSGLVPALIAEAVQIWGVHTLIWTIERGIVHADKNGMFEDNEHGRSAKKGARKLTKLLAPFAINAYSYPFQVVSTVMATIGSGLAVSMLPYAPSFGMWQNAYTYLKPNGGLKRGARMFLREQAGAISVGNDRLLYANYKHFA